MKLTHWWQLLELYEVILVWPLALVTLYLLVTAKTRRGRIWGASLLLLWFTPFIHRAVGDVYFDWLCKHEAGEFIYRTVDNVEGILQMRPRDGSIDYFDRMAMGDIPEDPWGHTNREAESPWKMIGRYKFIESQSSLIPSRYMRGMYDDSMFRLPSEGQSVARYTGYDGKTLKSFRKEFDSNVRSLYGYSWREATSWFDAFFNVHAGEITVHDLSREEVLGRKRGYFRSRPTNICPSGKDDRQTEKFVEKILIPAGN